MRHNDDAFAVMLLTAQLSPDREEYVHPFSTAEFRQLEARLKESRAGTLSDLITMDMSGMMLKLGYDEEQALRVCMLLGRTLPFSLQIEKLMCREIDFLTLYDAAYPTRFRDQLGVKAPPMFYLSGRPELFRQPAIALLGSKSLPAPAEQQVRALVRKALEEDYIILTDGTTGVGRIAETEACIHGGRVITLLAGAMGERIRQTLLCDMIAHRRAAAISLAHPDAPVTRAHAQARAKCIYAQAYAAFVFSCDAKGDPVWDGAAEALRHRYCPFIYAWNTDQYAGNRALLSQGALPLNDLSDFNFAQMSVNWRGELSEQLCFFDWKEPKLH